MRKYLFVLLATTLLLIACKKEPAVCGNNNSMTLTGDWYMVSYVAFMPQLPNLTRGDILWSFDANNQTITIQNTTNSLQPSGTYPYTNTATEITIQFTNYYQTFDYSFVNGELVLSDHPEVDGPMINFIR